MSQVDATATVAAPSVLAAVAQCAREAVSAEHAGIFVRAATGLQLAAADPADARPQLAEAVSDEAIAGGEPAQRTPDGRFARGRAIAAVPVGRQDGALWVSGPSSQAFTDQELARLEGLAAIAAAAVAEHRAAEPRRLGAGGVAALAALLDLRDGYAAADADEMVALACALGERLPLDATSLADLTVAAKLHDIGKIGVPDRILQKAGRLEPEERLVVQRHPVWGAAALARVPGLEGVAGIVRDHHERWDGSGYPAGLAGDAIPLASRIIGVCEAYRAMTSERPYRRSLDPEPALGIVIRASGSHFDPDVVEALVAVLGERGVRPGGPRTEHVAKPAAPGGYGQKLAAAFERVESAPALAESRERLLALLHAERPEAGEIVALVESDLALVIALLRLANRRSAASERIGSIPEAVAALTPEGVEMLASRIAVVDVFERTPAWSASAEHIRAHAISVQRVADRVGRALRWRARDELLAAALLHDVGKLPLGDAVEGYPESVHGTARTPEQRALAERHALALDHAAVGAVLLRRWRLPRTFVAAVEQHHARQPEGAAAVIALADQLVHQAHGQPIDPRRVTALSGILGLSRTELRSLMFDLPGGGTAAEPRSSEPCPLTAKELDVMRLLGKGMLDEEIAAELGIGTSTVRSHLHKAYKRLGVPDRARAVLHCTKRGWL